MTTPATPADAKSRAWRTFLQNLLVDVVLAVVVVILPLVSGDAVNWGLVAASAAKTALVTLLAFVQRAAEASVRNRDM
jgi:hypothetical protein